MTSDSQVIIYSPDVNLTERKSALNNSIQEVVTVGDIRGYKAYAALLTQSGGDNPESTTIGSLSIGRTYEITDYQLGDDFTNVGAPSNANGVKFVAIGDTPSIWANSSELTFNYGAPEVTVLENTIGNIWFTYNSIGDFNVCSDSLFTTNKSVIFISSSTADNSSAEEIVKAKIYDVNSMNILSFATSLSSDSILSNTPIEIRVYN
jgi:hypothetical protein